MTSIAIYQQTIEVSVRRLNNCRKSVESDVLMNGAEEDSKLIKIKFI